MAYFIVKLKNKDNIKITESEYKQIGGKSGLVFFPSNGETIDTNMIARILSEVQYNLELRESRVKSTTGILHTGEKAIRYFGQWYLDDGSYLDDPKTGRPTKPEKILDPKHYPEVAADCVPTIEEYQKNYAQLPPKKRLELIMGTINYSERQIGKKPLKELLEGAFERIDELHKKK